MRSGVTLWGGGDENRALYPGAKDIGGVSRSQRKQLPPTPVSRTSRSFPLPPPRGWEQEQHPKGQDAGYGLLAPLLSLRPLTTGHGIQCWLGRLKNIPLDLLFLNGGKREGGRGR